MTATAETTGSGYADQRGHDVMWMTAAEREAYERRLAWQVRYMEATTAAEFSVGQVVIVDEPGMGYTYNGVIAQYAGAGAYTVMDSAGYCMDHGGRWLQSAGWSVPADERPFPVS